MKKRLVILFVSIVFLSNLYGQETTVYQSKWQIRPLVGLNVPMTKLLQNNITDYLFEYDDNPTPYWQILSVSYFFSKHWGIEFNLQAGDISNKAKKRGNNFISTILSEYSNKYYVKPFTPAINAYDDYGDTFMEVLIAGRISRGYLGLIYRIESDKFYVYPKFSVGISSFSSNWGGADLKEKNSNNEYKLYYSPGKFPSDNFTVAPSVSFGYKLTKRFYLNMDVLASYYKTNVIFEKTTTLNALEIQRELIDYKKDIFNISLGVGLILVLH